MRRDATERAVTGDAFISEAAGTGHTERARPVLGRFMAVHESLEKFERNLKKVRLAHDPGHDASHWVLPFEGPIATEKQLHDSSDNRIGRTHPSHRIRRGEVLANGSILDSVVIDGGTGLSRVLFEYKRPTYCADGTFAPLDLLAHLDQAVGYASQIMMSNPAIAFLAIILTDGFSYTAGYSRRRSLQDLKFTICETPLSLYTTTAQGANFKLFWELFSHASPEPISVKLQVRSNPVINVEIGKCIGNGASSIVYEGKLMNDSKSHGPGDVLYSSLEASGKFAVKIFKLGQGEIWTVETLAMDELKQAGAQDCCVFPICSGTLGKLFFIVYPLGIPVLPTVSVKPVATSPLKLKHYAGLLKDLCRIHDVGLIHRDVRLENIVMIGDAAKLIDFGYSTEPTDEEFLFGTLATASQDVLAAALEGDIICYEPRDDLESLLKLFLMHYGGFKVQYSNGESRTETLYEAWAPMIASCGAANLGYADLRKHLEQIFTTHSKSWKEHVYAPSKNAMSE